MNFSTLARGFEGLRFGVMCEERMGDEAAW